MTSKGGCKKDELRAEFLGLIQALGTEDMWFTFSRKARAFIKAYEVLSPDPEVLKYSDDMKWVAMFLPYATRHFEQREDVTLKDYSAKIREMLERHLDVTGISTVIKLRTLTDLSIGRILNRRARQGKTCRRPPFARPRNCAANWWNV